MDATGVCAISIEDGMAGFDMADVDFKRGLIEVSAATAMMLASVKLETAAPYCMGWVTDVDHLIVEHDAPASIVAALRETGTAVRITERLVADHCAPPPGIG